MLISKIKEELLIKEITKLLSYVIHNILYE